MNKNFFSLSKKPSVFTFTSFIAGIYNQFRMRSVIKFYSKIIPNPKYNNQISAIIKFKNTILSTISNIFRFELIIKIIHKINISFSEYYRMILTAQSGILHILGDLKFAVIESPTVVQFFMTINNSIKSGHFYRLGEYDPLTLGDMDAMTLGELDFIEVP